MFSLLSSFPSPLRSSLLHFITCPAEHQANDTTSASYDILRLYDLQDEESAKHARVPFLIVPGHRTGVVSQLYIDQTCSYMISVGGNRGWEGMSTEVLLGYEIGCIAR